MCYCIKTIISNFPFQSQYWNCSAQSADHPGFNKFTWDLELKAKRASAVALDRSTRSRKNGKASLKMKHKTHIKTNSTVPTRLRLHICNSYGYWWWSWLLSYITPSHPHSWWAWRYWCPGQKGKHMGCGPSPLPIWRSPILLQEWNWCNLCES